MRERPILFSAPMVRAILNGTKTQTRRVAKLTANGHVKEPGGHRRWHTADFDARLACPYGQPGDRLWVRETFAEGIHQMADVNHWAYAADHFGTQQRLGDRWKPGIHMPRAASRITLEVTSVRVERLQDISEADAIAEGCAKNHNGYYWGGPHAVSGLKQMATAVSAYQDLWESINGPGSCDANPLVWVVEFRQIDAATSAADSR